MQYKVPQFIEIEDKVVGPLTFRQFVYIAGGAGMAFVLYIRLPVLIALPLILVVVGLAAALAFYKINNKPFSYFIESALRYSINSKLYVWRKELKKPEAKEKSLPTKESLHVPKLSGSKLGDISWSLDVHEDLNETLSMEHVTQDDSI